MSDPDTDAIEIVGAEANNLKFVDVGVPLREVTLIAGASGSGKSSLLSDTLAAEVDRRRSILLGLAREHDAAAQAWVGPAPFGVHFGQRPFRASSRTTVATATGLLSLLRRLFLKHALLWSDLASSHVPEPSAATWAAWLTRHQAREVVVWGVPVRYVATDGRRAVERLHEHGIATVIVRSETDTPARWKRGRELPTSGFKGLARTTRHIIEARVGTAHTRREPEVLRSLLDRAFAAAGGLVVVELPGAEQDVVQSEFGPRLDSTVHRLLPEDPLVYQKPSTHLLSFNAPSHPQSGACRTCAGTGRTTVVDEQALVTRPERSLHEGTLSLWTEKNYRYVNIQHETIEGLRGQAGLDPDLPWRDLPESAKALVLDGSANPVVDRARGTGRPLGSPRPYEGFRRAILRRFIRGSATTAKRLAHLVREGPCEACGGSRWSPQARALRLGVESIGSLLDSEFHVLPCMLDEARFSLNEDACATLQAIEALARALESVGLGYLTGSRGMTEVSTGEARRALLSVVLHAPVDDLLLLLDEPARGLHEQDIAGLAFALRRLSASHTVVCCDHRRGLLASVDHLVDLGSVGGPGGGQIRYAGPPSGAPDNWMRKTERLPSLPVERWLRVRRATMHNLTGVDVDLPLGQLTCITGVSGSGKSSLVRGVLVPALLASMPPASVDVEDFEISPGGHCELQGVDALDAVVALDQRVPPANRRSLVLTRLGLSQPMRAAYAEAQRARELGLDEADFGFNAGTGRCERCLGLGEIATHGHATPCPSCGGARFGPAAMSVELEGVGPAAFLGLPIDALRMLGPDFLTPHRALLDAISALGLGYLSLGRRVDTLSGGEVQRLRIARVLGGRAQQRVLFVLDEPAAGLHPSDVARLLGALRKMLADGRNTVLLVEHHPDLIAAAQHVVEIGPGSGPRGGRIVAHGTPDQVRGTDCATGRMLADRATRVQHLPRPTMTTRVPVDSQGAARARTWLRYLLGDSVEPPDGSSDRDVRDRPGVLATPELLSTSLFELAALDEQLASFLIAQNRVSDDQGVQHIAETWSRHPEARLQIHPFLDDMQVWGTQLPRSVQAHATALAQQLGLELTGDNDLCAARAVGPPLAPRAPTLDAQRTAVELGLRLGAGFVELITPSGTVPLAALATRPMDLERGLVGPLRPVPAHLLRREPAGACPACGGRGSVVGFDESLLIAHSSAPPTADTWLTAEALALLRGIRRSVLLPFLKRLTAEGLQPSPAGLQKLLLHGFWHRPGPGSFLKKRKDPAEVASWLRWDGLFATLEPELGRSKHADWRRAVVASRRQLQCPTCDGTGLRVTASLFALGGWTLQDLVHGGTVGDLFDLLAAAPSPGEPWGFRQRRLKRDLLHALMPAVDANRDLPLREPAPPAIASAVFRNVVASVATAPVVS